MRRIQMEAEERAELEALGRLLDDMSAEVANRVERRVGKRRWIIGSGAGAVAAAVATLAVLGTLETGGLGSGDPGAGGATAAAEFDAGLDVEAPGPFVVFPTSDENITVIWLLGEG
jgi:hypothetical protein